MDQSDPNASGIRAEQACDGQRYVQFDWAFAGAGEADNLNDSRLGQVRARRQHVPGGGGLGASEPQKLTKQAIKQGQNASSKALKYGAGNFTNTDCTS